MIHFTLIIAGKSARRFDTDNPVINIGRSPTNDIQIPTDNISSQHGTISLIDVNWIYRDLNSTNGSMLIRDGQRYLLTREPREIVLQAGDQICLASNDNIIRIEAIDPEPELDDEFERTILAEQEPRRAAELESSLGEDFEALRSTLELARELSTVESVQMIASLACSMSLKAFPKARRVLFLTPRGGDNFAIESCISREGGDDISVSMIAGSRRLIDRCLTERKGFLFLFEHNQMQAIGTRVIQSEELDTGAGPIENRVVLACPLYHQERCLGMLELEGPLDVSGRSTLTRRDLALASLMGHMLAARLHELAQQADRLKLARKATAGYLAATVGHCFKNLLFVPMSMSKMLPMCIQQGRMDEVEWMLARNGVNIRYLDILSNEFAAASKDPTDGFEDCDLVELLSEVAELINQIGPEKICAAVRAPEDFGEVFCHPAALKRLLMNLTLNAVDAIFGMKDAPKGCIDLVLENLDGGEKIRLTVRDNGPGIPEAILDNLRGIFDQVRASADALSQLQQIAESVRSTKEQGFKEHYGLGFLFVCQTVHQHQGDLAISAEPGKGTVFTIDLPRKGPALLREKALAAGAEAE